MFNAAIITDLDNTLYNWVDYFAPCFRAMVHVIARAQRLDETVITNDFRDVFGRHGSVEYAFSVQELRLCDGLSHDEVAELVRLAKGAFSRVRQKNLRVYPGVKETLRWARDHGIAIVGVTNSPTFQATRRLSELYIDQFFTGLAAWEGHSIPQNDPWVAAVRERAEGKGWATKIPHVWSFSESDLKPSPRMYADVLTHLRLRPSQTWVVGDSLQKDIAPALDMGMVGVWAKYGLTFGEKNFKTLLDITHWSDARVASTYAHDVVTPSCTIDSFDQLRTIVPPPQGELFHANL